MINRQEGRLHFTFGRPPAVGPIADLVQSVCQSARGCFSSHPHHWELAGVERVQPRGEVKRRNHFFIQLVVQTEADHFVLTSYGSVTDFSQMKHEYLQPDQQTILPVLWKPLPLLSSYYLPKRTTIFISKSTDQFCLVWEITQIESNSMYFVFSLLPL